MCIAMQNAQSCNVIRHQNGELCQNSLQGGRGGCGIDAGKSSPGNLCIWQDGKGSQLRFEGVMADRRIGGTDRESYAFASESFFRTLAREDCIVAEIELKNAIGIGTEDEIVAFVPAPFFATAIRCAICQSQEGIKRLYDAFIDDMDPVERRLQLGFCWVATTVMAHARPQDQIDTAQNRIKASWAAFIGSVAIAAVVRMFHICRVTFLIR